MSKGDEEDTTSPEAAGVARGAARTASTISRRAALGRLPQPKGRVAFPKARPVPRSSPAPGSGLFPKKVPTKHVAKFSDRISTGIDAYNAASSSTLRDEKPEQKHQLVQMGRRFASFSGMLVKNTIMGAGLFEAFEKTIAYIDGQNQISTQAQAQALEPRNQEEGTLIGDAFSRTSVKQHFIAGAVGGSVHSALYMTFQSGAFIKEFGLNSLRTLPIASVSTWSVVHTCHHALAHGLLFSSYEGTKRLLLSENSSDLRLHLPTFQNDKRNGDMQHQISDIIIVGFAGGIAGQIQHVASHFTETWFNVGENDSVRNYLKNQKDAKVFLRGPTFRSIVSAFPPSAIGFISFEFGKQLLE